MKKKLFILGIVLSVATIMWAEKDEENNPIQQIIQQTQTTIENIIQNNIGQETEETEVTEEVTEEESKPREDVSDGSKFVAYDKYEISALATKNPETIYKMAQLYFRDGLYERAVNVAKKDGYGDIRNLYVVAIGSRLIGNYDQSIDYYNRILSKSNHAEARLGRGIAYKSKGEFDKALEDLKAYARTNPTPEVNRTIQEINTILSSK